LRTVSVRKWSKCEHRRWTNDVICGRARGRWRMIRAFDWWSDHAYKRSWERWWTAVAVGCQRRHMHCSPIRRNLSRMSWRGLASEKHVKRRVPGSFLYTEVVFLHELLYSKVSGSCGHIGQYNLL
jgi:hypothetical protein